MLKRSFKQEARQTKKTIAKINKQMEPHPDTLRIIDDAIEASGYAMTDRERFIAAWFFEEGAKKVTVIQPDKDDE